MPTVDAPVGLLAGLTPDEAAVLDAVLAVPADGVAGRPEELLAEALAPPVDRVDAVVTALCRRLGAPGTGPARVPGLGARARARGIASA